MKIQAEMAGEELKQLSRIREKQTLSFDFTNEMEEKYSFILIGTHQGNKIAVKCVGNWKEIVTREVRKLCPWGIKTVNPGLYVHTTATSSYIRFNGYVICEDTHINLRGEKPSYDCGFNVNEFRFKVVPEPKSNLIEPEYL
jgi:hypothetical protein